MSIRLLTRQLIILAMCAATLGCGIVDSENNSQDPSFSIYIPNVLSRDNGYGELFYPLTSKDDTWINEMSIYDAWGNLVFIQEDFPANDTDYAWDGLVDGKQASSGTYYYVIVLTNESDTLTYKGDFTLFS